MRGHSGAYQDADGRFVCGDVTPTDLRAHHLGKLLHRAANGDSKRLPAEYQEQLDDPMVRFVPDLLGRQPTSSDWNEALNEFVHRPYSPLYRRFRSRRWYQYQSANDNALTLGKVSATIHHIFAPDDDVPPELREIYSDLF